MARMYTVTWDGVSITNANGDYDIAELVPASTKPIELVGMDLTVTSELGEAQEEWLRVQVFRGLTASGSGGTTPTPAPIDPSDAAAGFTCELNNPTVATTGTAVPLATHGLQVRNGLQVWYPDRCGPRATTTQTALYIRMTAAVTDDVTMSGTLWINEV